MGKGLALQFKKAFPENFQNYERAAKNNKIRIGKVFVTEIDTDSRIVLISEFHSSFILASIFICFNGSSSSSSSSSGFIILLISPS